MTARGAVGRLGGRGVEQKGRRTYGQQCGDSQREGSWKDAEEGKGGINGDEKQLRFGQWVHDAVADALLSCTLETCMVLLTNITPINSIKNV